MYGYLEESDKPDFTENHRLELACRRVLMRDRKLREIFEHDSLLTTDGWQMRYNEIFLFILAKTVRCELRRMWTEG